MSETSLPLRGILVKRDIRQRIHTFKTRKRACPREKMGRPMRKIGPTHYGKRAGPISVNNESMLQIFVIVGINEDCLPIICLSRYFSVSSRPMSCAREST